MRSSFIIYLTISAVSVAGAANAQSASDWQWQATPYAWMSGLKGNVGTVAGLPPTEVDIPFRDILDDLDFAGMFMASARNDPWVFYLDSTYVKTSTTEALGGVVFDSIGIRSKTTTFALAAGRTVASSPKGHLDAYVGARAWWLSNSFKLRGVNGGTTSQTEKASWVNPLIGVAGRYRADDRWTLFGALEVGGFGVGADSEWSVLAGATYSVSDSFGVSMGWRHMEVDYDKGGVLFDVEQSGPVLGATFRF
ncbi:hypothetical protein OE699_10890 [Sedimentimonas flavescens]|uniref:Outer membrane protein beta-barrel domain-containing protein n=1 Tax=Sedimentimonas flavescens TaxID=2851012 RepID=A0ABT3A026_9RHOB|nr:hypothetical protein [Sedimentimonas flavescens]MCV2879363.1 hypothetical protein [Sedimentimonas flavescens]